MTLDRRQMLFAVASLACVPDWVSAGDATALDDVVKPLETVGGPGFALCVVRDGTILYQKFGGFADVEMKRTITIDSHFRLASLSKAFTAMAVLALIERGDLSFDTRLPQVFPGFPAYGDAITLRHLLNHTSGLLDFGTLIPAGQTAQLRDGDVLEMMKRVGATKFPPGSKFEYSNTGYVLLGLVVQHASGSPFGTFLRKAVFGPVGMKTTRIYEGETTPIASRAYGYIRDGDGFRRKDQSLMSALQGDGCIYSSVREMVQWDRALTRGTLVRADLMRAAFTSGHLNDGTATGYGFGWFVDAVNGHRRLWHSGGTVGFSHHFVRLPDDRLSVILLTNRGDASPEAITDRMAAAIIPGLKPPEPLVHPVARERLQVLQGYYDLRGSLTTIVIEDGKLNWLGAGPKPVVLLPTSETTFFYESAELNPDRNWRLRFEARADTAIERISYVVNDKVVFTLPYLGPLCSDLSHQAHADPEPEFTRRLAAWLKGEEGGGLPPLSERPAAAVNASPEFLGRYTPNAIATRSQRTVAKVHNYALSTDKSPVWLVVSRAGDGSVLGADVVPA